MRALCWFHCLSYHPLFLISFCPVTHFLSPDPPHQFRAQIWVLGVISQAGVGRSFPWCQSQINWCLFNERRQAHKRLPDLLCLEFVCFQSWCLSLALHSHTAGCCQVFFHQRNGIVLYLFIFICWMFSRKQFIPLAYPCHWVRWVPEQNSIHPICIWNHFFLSFTDSLVFFCDWSVRHLFFFRLPLSFWFSPFFWSALTWPQYPSQVFLAKKSWSFSHCWWG